MAGELIGTAEAIPPLRGYAVGLGIGGQFDIDTACVDASGDADSEVEAEVDMAGRDREGVHEGVRFAG